jgi:actin-like ATPase involved in cell morphogenesis
MPIFIANDPLHSVVLGSGLALENIEALGSVLSQGHDD